VLCRCGHELGPAGSWKAGAARRVIDPAVHRRQVQLHEEMEIREYACPACGRLLESAVARIEDPDLVTAVLR
jgi:N-methylhydantoinase B